MFIEEKCDLMRFTFTNILMGSLPLQCTLIHANLVKFVFWWDDMVRTRYHTMNQCTYAQTYQMALNMKAKVKHLDRCLSPSLIHPQCKYRVSGSLHWRATVVTRHHICKSVCSSVEVHNDIAGEVLGQMQGSLARYGTYMVRKQINRFDLSILQWVIVQTFCCSNRYSRSSVHNHTRFI